MTKVSVKPARSAIVAMYAGLALTVVTLDRPLHRPRNRQCAGRPHPRRLSHVQPGAHRHGRHDLPGVRVHHRSARRHLLALDNPDRQRREAMGARRRDRDVRARNRHRAVRSPRQGHLWRYRPATAARLDRNAAMPGRASSSHAALEEIVIGTGQRSRGTCRPSAALTPDTGSLGVCMTCVQHSFL